MPAIQGNDRALTPARAGVARAGVTRAGFTPKNTVTVGSRVGHYIWRNTKGTKSNEIAITWTEVRP